MIADSLASKRVEVAVVTFGDEVQTLCDFTTAANFVPPVLEPSGLTPMGVPSISRSTCWETRKQQYRENGIAYYRPWLFLITDGAPNDDGWEYAAQRAVEGERSKAFAFFGVGVQVR